MNRGNMLQSSSVQQMLSGGPNSWWSITPTPKPSTSPPPPASSQPRFSAASFPHQLAPPWQHTQELPDSLSELLMGGSVGEEDKKLESWEEQLLHDHHNQHNSLKVVNEMLESTIKQENSLDYGSSSYGDFHCLKPNNWSNPMIPVSSPNSCISSLSNSMLDFSTTITDNIDGRQPPPDHRSAECNSSAITGGASKKAKIQQSTNQSTFKVRKEKLGDRITTLHQIVSPFGKTDTASVLLEAIGYIRFLHTQIEALSLPYLQGSGSRNTSNRQHSVQQGEINNCLFPEDPGQLLNDSYMKMKGFALHQDSHEKPDKDLRSRGLCLVPVSCTMQVGTDNIADYWPPTLNGGFR